MEVLNGIQNREENRQRLKVGTWSERGKTSIGNPGAKKSRRAQGNSDDGGKRTDDTKEDVGRTFALMGGTDCQALIAHKRQAASATHTNANKSSRKERPKPEGGERLKTEGKWMKRRDMSKREKPYSGYHIRGKFVRKKGGVHSLGRLVESCAKLGIQRGGECKKSKIRKGTGHGTVFSK